MNKKRTIARVFLTLLVFIAAFVITFNLLDRRLTGNNVRIVRVPDDTFNRQIPPLPPSLQMITHEEFMATIEEEAEEELSYEEARESIERDFAAVPVAPPRLIPVHPSARVAGLRNDSIFERQEISDNIINVLFLGDDALIHQDRGRSDTIMMLSFNRDTRVVSLTSFMRDILVPDRIGSAHWNRMNFMYAVGGPGRTINLMNDLFALDIQRFAVVRFAGVFALVDALDGLELHLRADEAAVINRIFPDFEEVSAGYNLLNGRQVLAYSRMRIVDNDFVRTQRQKNVLRSILDRVLDTTTMGDVFTIASFILEHVDTNFTLGEMITLGVDLFVGSRPTIEELRIPIDGSFRHAVYNGAYILAIDFNENITALHEAIYSTAYGVTLLDFVLPEMDRPEIAYVEEIDEG
ncbi:MAG: LCP family protein [Spirochaetes bacterium]|nr:LCP family protein [Spirochaetota bacterium]